MEVAPRARVRPVPLPAVVEWQQLGPGPQLLVAVVAETEREEEHLCWHSGEGSESRSHHRHPEGEKIEKLEEK